MTISERIEQDLKEAMRARQAEKLSVLRMLKSALMNAAIEKGGGPQGKVDDADATAVIRKQVKQRQDSIESFRKGGRAEQAAKEQAEIELLNAYLPQPLDAAALAALVEEAIRETGATTKAQTGLVMKALQPKVAGRADGKTLSQEVQKRLEGLSSN
ncbi:MAG: GatB/YqeY domain-containing protein [Verrucomicrobia bacterium]|nr:GatB/YqeY domain-containing protein [Verrucomicrobiota bacterium]